MPLTEAREIWAMATDKQPDVITKQQLDGSAQAHPTSFALVHLSNTTR